MLFNSIPFLAFFLPVTLCGFYLLSRSGRRGLTTVWLLGCSLFFYGWWDPGYLPILTGSVVVNFWLGRRLARTGSRALLAAGVIANLAALGYFKYAAFALNNLNALTGIAVAASTVAIPLGISFFTFQQIAYLVDARAGHTRENRFGPYATFVTFFPQLIAGPIVHHRELMPQFDKGASLLPRASDIAAGITVFTIGLWKKVMIADTLAVTADAGFAAAATGSPLHLVEAWVIAVGYALQIYFDFSGYSDMAIGLALLFGVRLPVNFDSPFKARGVIDYWSRWHMTLTRFLTAHIYNPILLWLTRRRARAGKPPLRARRPPVASFVLLLAGPTLLTMFLAGLWHGAGYQFIIFGVLHGIFLVINHAWRMYGAAAFGTLNVPLWLRHTAATLTTFTAVVIALVFFRASTVSHALTMLGWMGGSEGVSLPPAARSLVEPTLGRLVEFAPFEIVGLREIGLVALLLAVVWGLPNTQQWLAAGGYAIGIDSLGRRTAPRGQDTIAQPFRWHPSPAVAMAIGSALAIVVLTIMSEAPSVFIYFNF